MMSLPAKALESLESFVLSKTDNVFVQLLRYTLVGGIAFVVDFSLLIVLTERLGLHYLVSAALSFIAGLMTNYVLSVSWVFSKRRLASRTAEFGAFAGIGIVGLALNELFMWLFTERLGLYYPASKLMSAILVYLWNFFGRRTALFR